MPTLTCSRRMRCGNNSPKNDGPRPRPPAGAARSHEPLRAADASYTVPSHGVVGHLGPPPAPACFLSGAASPAINRSRRGRWTAPGPISVTWIAAD
jgi:hypothetical protein